MANVSMKRTRKRQVLEAEGKIANKAVYFQKNLDRSVLV
ncbi:MAG: hypothetical protein ACJAQT_003333 [Akkermansiaceae bacterium]|jgi:hypothetical protein